MPYSSNEPPPVSPWGTSAASDDAALRARHHARVVAALPGRWMSMPVQFGGRSSTVHDITLKFGPMRQDGSLSGHLVAQTPSGPVAARDVIAWDPLLQKFEVDNDFQVEQLFRRLNPLAAMCGSLCMGLSKKASWIVDVMGDLFVPRFFVVGGIGTILFAYAFHYWLWFFLVQFLLFYVILPGAAVAVAAGLFYHLRLQPLKKAMFQAAWRAYDEEAHRAGR